MIKILLLVGTVGFVGYKFYERWQDRIAPTPTPAKQEQLNHGVTTSSSETSRKVGDSKAKESWTYFVYTFENREVPEIPKFFEASKGASISIDVESNSWVMKADAASTLSLKHIAKSLDISPEEMDLDFVMLSVSEEWLRQLGLRAYFSEGGSFLSTLNLESSDFGLRFAIGNAQVFLDGGMSDSKVQVVSSPSVRILEGHQFKLNAETSQPVPVQQLQDGVQRISVSYRDVGLKMSGSVSRSGDYWVLNSKIENGQLGSNVKLDNLEVRSEKRQVIESQCRMELFRWSIIGGIRREVAERTKGILSYKNSKSNDLLVIFVRPRHKLYAPPQAVPVNQGAGGHPLLPSKNQTYTGK